MCNVDPKTIPESDWWPQYAAFQVHHIGSARHRLNVNAARHKAPLQKGFSLARIAEEVYKAYQLVLSGQDEFYYYFTW